MYTKTNQTFQARISDQAKTPLAKEFVDFIADVAIMNDITDTSVWYMWRDYSNQCTNFDQSPLMNEFKQWKNLK